MKTVIVTNHFVKFYSGSELITIDLLSYFASKADYKVYLATFQVGNPLQQLIPKNVETINLSNQPMPIRQADLIIGHHYDVIDKVLETVSCKNVVQNSLSPYCDIIEDYSTHITKALANSAETKRVKQYQTQLPIDIFVNSVNSSFINADRKQLTGTINKIAVITNHQWHKGITKKNVDIIGSTQGKLVTAELLKQYDVVVTIGRTVQMCLVLGIPVYCYDHFGGHGYITLHNIDFNEEMNFSGRQKDADFTEPKSHDFAKIFNDIYHNYMAVCTQQKQLIEIAKQRYNFETNLNNVLKDITI